AACRPRTRAGASRAAGGQPQPTWLPSRNLLEDVRTVLGVPGPDDRLVRVAGQHGVDDLGSPAAGRAPQGAAVEHPERGQLEPAEPFQLTGQPADVPGPTELRAVTGQQGVDVVAAAGQPGVLPAEELLEPRALLRERGVGHADEL